jgi:hypothetical protein
LPFWILYEAVESTPRAKKHAISDQRIPINIRLTDVSQETASDVVLQVLQTISYTSVRIFFLTSVDFLEIDLPEECIVSVGRLLGQDTILRVECTLLSVGGVRSSAEDFVVPALLKEELADVKQRARGGDQSPKQEISTPSLHKRKKRGVFTRWRFAASCCGPWCGCELRKTVDYGKIISI